MDKKAFTLIELMGVIIVLGLISLIAIPTIDKSLKNSKENLYKVQIKNITESAKSWSADNTALLPDNDGESITLTLGQLKVGGYVAKDITNPKKNELFPNDMEIIITRVINNYTFLVDEKSGTKGNTDLQTGTLVILNGSSTVYVEVGSSYEELGAVGKNPDGTVNNNVSIEIKSNNTTISNIETDRYGTYKITYKIDDNGTISSAVRTVIVRDTTPPELTIPGNVTLTPAQVSTFNAMNGVSATDNNGEAVNITVSGNVSTIPGTYILTYTATDSKGNKAVKTRTVIVGDIFDIAKGVNSPQLSTGMTPIKWVNGVEATTTAADQDWYDYANKKWANVKTADGSYWVWIPRYAYRITSGYHSSTTGTIDVKFLKGASDVAVDGINIKNSGYIAGTNDTSMYYFTHPVFQNDINKYGFWVAKFEPTAAEGVASTSSCSAADNVTTKTIKIIPNAISWCCINLANTFNTSINMKNKSVYGWKAAEVDTHMMTNMEWGAVAYLSKSVYGVNTSEVWNNANNQYKTGCSGSGIDAINESTCVSYETTNGQKASTTYNIYGVYDMSGGAWDRVMANYNNLPGTTSGYTGQDIANINSKYINRYTTSSGNLLNGVGMNYDLTVYGDAVYETSNGAYRYDGSTWYGNAFASWYSDDSILPATTYPFFYRGGFYGYGSRSGIFSFNAGYGEAAISYSFRPIVSIIN